MESKLLPFNIEILTLTEQTLKMLNPVRVLDIFEGRTKNFNPEGLFSTEIFGKVGTEQRNKTFSYIDLKTRVIHPLLFRITRDFKELYGGIMMGTQYAVFDKTLGDFVKATPMDGETGYSFFLKHVGLLKLSDNNSEKRKEAIAVFQNAWKNSKYFMTKLLVMPAGLRDYEIDAHGKPSESEINGFYRKLLSLSHLITKADPESRLLDGTRYRMQVELLALYEHIESMLRGKRKLILGKWASRQIYNGTRNVITSMINNTSELHGSKLVNMNSTMVGLFQFLKASLPISIYHIRNGFLTKVMPGPTLPFYMTNKKTLKKEQIRHEHTLFEQWMTEEGLEKTITRYGEIPLRHMVLETNTHYMGLIYKDPERGFMLLQDIDELPEGFDKSKVSPLTFTELLYVSVFGFANGLPAFVTRYPITGTGSIYPSFTYLKTTIKSLDLVELDPTGQPTGRVAHEFPIMGDKFMNSVSPHPSHIARLGADYDGDTVSLNIAYSEESKEEIKKYLASRRFYIDSNGELTFSMATDTVNFVVKNLLAA